MMCEKDESVIKRKSHGEMDLGHFEINSKQGRLKGLIKKSDGSDKTSYYSFQGIPYAKPPVGKLRFKDPVPFGKWEGVWDATKEGNDAHQSHMLFNHMVGDEDCLYLNVYTNKPSEEETRKAVMVWIHGGGFRNGSGSSELYGPDYLLQDDIVLVTINYRCGAFGFLSLENETLSGNFGLKDQSLALLWVQENIVSFGGDPNNVTIFGESAGGASVNYHLLSPLSKGLFHKAILQSGFSVCQWALQSKPKEKALLLAQQLGCTSVDPDKVLEFLMTVPAVDIIKAQDKEALLTDKDKIHRFNLIFLPCIEKKEDGFLLDDPVKLMERGEFATVPIIMGITDKEGFLGLAIKNIHSELINKDLSLLVPCNLDIERGSKEEQQLGKQILNYYTNSDSISWEVMDKYVDFISDNGFSIGLESSRQCVLRHSSVPVFTYLFTYISSRSISSFMLPMADVEAAKFVGTGACHGDELAHLFKTNMPQATSIPPSPDDQSFMTKFVKAWTTFAKTGNPNCNELGVTWKPDNIQKPNYLELGKVFKMVESIMFPERMEFWKKLYEKYS